MSWGLPKLPGLTFRDPTRTNFHVERNFHFRNGYRFYKPTVRGVGGAPTDLDSNAFREDTDTCSYDPSLTYGRVKQPALPAVIPHWALYATKALTFRAFFKQSVFDSPTENYCVRVVNIIYFLEDDTITVMEPRIKNSGLWQGRMVRREKVPKNDLGDCWHWKDLDIGKDILIYGKVFHTVSCDEFTREYMLSQGIELREDETMPTDPHEEKAFWSNLGRQNVKAPKDPPMRRYMMYDGMVLAFNCVWDDRDEEHGEMREYKLLYFLVDDTMAVKECHDGKGGRDPFPLLLKKMKIPKNYKERPIDYPAIFMEAGDQDTSDYYSPTDLKVGDTLFILGRRMFIFDCDRFTREFYRDKLGLEQPPRVEVYKKKPQEYVRPLPPHIGIGEPQDALQSCFSLQPKPPRRDVIKYNLNANKNLRYLCELDWIHPEDDGRRFVLSYSLADNKIKIGEVPRRNSGIIEGSFLKAMMVETPQSDHDFPTYYTPDMFYIGAIVQIFKHRFRILGCDLYVYRYMEANPEKFPLEVFNNVRNYHLREGNLKDDLKEAAEEEAAAARRLHVESIGKAAVKRPSRYESCLQELNVHEGRTEPPPPVERKRHTGDLDYDDYLRETRHAGEKSVCPSPLKGILKSGAPSDEYQKVVCFNAAVAPGQEPGKLEMPSPIRDTFCDQFKDEESRRMRESGECPYPVVNGEEPGQDASPAPHLAAARENDNRKFLEREYDLHCDKIPQYMRLPSDVYRQAKEYNTKMAAQTTDEEKALRPAVGPKAVKFSEYPKEEFPAPDREDCEKKFRSQVKSGEEDVDFLCRHPELKLPCCENESKCD